MALQDPAELKATLRKAALAARAKAQDPKASLRACDHLCRYLLPQSAGKIVAGYMPIRSEIDPAHALKTLQENEISICLPVVKGPDLPLEFHAWQPGDEMTEGAFGAAIPKTVAPMHPDILIMPLVGFDRHGNRLGYGGGYYDRSIAELERQKRVLRMGFAYAAQELNEIPAGTYDQRLSAIVTEDGMITFDTP